MQDMITRIPLETLLNTRDLGGITSSDGRQIKKLRLIRSGRLSNLTEKDKQTLINDYQLTTIVDFRTNTEKSEVPDDIIDGVKYIHLPIVEEAVIGITKEKSSAENSTLSLFKMMSGENFSSAEFMASIYSGIISSESARKQYRKFLEIIQNHEKGSVLWHCSAGKDRVGVGTAILLSALGVPRGTITLDYLKTNDFTADDANRSLTAMRYNGVDEKIVSGMLAMYRVEESYINTIFASIENEFGGIGNFLRTEMKFSKSDLADLCGKYLK